MNIWESRLSLSPSRRLEGGCPPPINPFPLILGIHTRLGVIETSFDTMNGQKRLRTSSALGTCVFLLVQENMVSWIKHILFRVSSRKRFQQVVGAKVSDNDSNVISEKSTENNLLSIWSLDHSFLLYMIGKKLYGKPKSTTFGLIATFSFDGNSRNFNNQIFNLYVNTQFSNNINNEASGINYFSVI